MKKNDQIRKFDDANLALLSFKFSLSGTNNTKMDKSLQTDEITYESQETMTKKGGRTVKLQVEEEAINTAVASKLNEEEYKIDDDAINQFLLKISPFLYSQLDQKIQYLEHYDPRWTDERKENKTLYVLSNVANRSYEIEKNLQITDICWNCNGLILAASYGRSEHFGTDNEKSYICTWNLSKRNFDQDKPSQCLETDSSIISLEFHPTKPSWLVGGSFNGEIFIWDLSKEEDNIIGRSSIDEYFHREAVTQFIWYELKQQGSTVIQHNLLSISTDGKILLWDMKYEENQKTLLLDFPIKGFSLVRKKDGLVSSVGGLCMTQACEDKNTFIIGSEAGSVLRAVLTNINSDKKNKVLLEQSSNYKYLPTAPPHSNTYQAIKWKPSTFPLMTNLLAKNLPDIKQHVEQYCKRKNLNEVEINDVVNSKPDIRKLYINPISFAFEQHMGPVYSLDFSMFHRNVFLSSSIDGTIKLYDLLQSKSLMSYEVFNSQIFKVMWSYVRPCIFAAALSDGNVNIYDISSKKKDPVYILQPDQQSQALNVKFNKRQFDLIAVSYSNCKIRIFQLTDELCVAKKDEFVILQNIIEDLKGT